MKLKHIVALICLAVGGGLSLHYGETELAGVCFGAIASWGLVNGVQKTQS